MGFKKVPLPVLESLLKSPNLSEEDRKEIEDILRDKVITPSNWIESQKESLVWNDKRRNGY